MEELVQRASQEYLNRFGQNPDIAVFAPGRVNLIGFVCFIVFCSSMFNSLFHGMQVNTRITTRATCFHLPYQW
jgi:hypothetical protein